MPSMSFLILHGWQGSGPVHWQTSLTGRLRDRGERVSYPELPEPDTPRLDRWCEALDLELAREPGGLVVLCHSLACVLWLQHARVTDGYPRAERVLLVAPPSPTAVRPIEPAPTSPMCVRLRDGRRSDAGARKVFTACPRRSGWSGRRRRGRPC